MYGLKSKNDVEVLIQGKKYTLCGYESSEYMQKIANYINTKYNELKDKENYSSLDMDLRTVLLNINLADDFFKAEKRVSELEADTDLKDKMVYNIKLELIASQTRFDEIDHAKKEIEKKYEEAQKEIVKLQTQLKNRNSK